jgi:ribosomal protein S18 acetylase RimI-like enzyme
MITTLVRLGTSDIPRASAQVGRAFHHDPFLNHFLPDPDKRTRLSPKGFRCILRYGVYYGEAYTTSSEMEAVAVWLPPQSAHASLFRMVRVGALAVPFTMGRRFFFGFLRFLEHVESLRAQHTPFPHWYLQLLGVEPQWQRQGYGSTLLRPMLERFDKAGISCCLDTENGNNVPYYERFGFKVVAETKAPKTDIGVWLMARKTAIR